jgi:hypothetical protein
VTAERAAAPAASAPTESTPAVSARPVGPVGRLGVIACETVVEEMQAYLQPEATVKTMDFGLHIFPERLRAALQAAIDELDADHDTILLGYGQCARAIVGLRADHAVVAVPATDDCIAIFLGSKAAYTAQQRAEAGTYYLTKGWIEVGDTPFSEYQRLVDRYGEAKADRVTRLMLRNYRRLAFIHTGTGDPAKYVEHAESTAARFDLRFEEVEGKPDLVRKLVEGPWDEEVLAVPPGTTITDAHFGRTGAAGCPPMPGLAR